MLAAKSDPMSVSDARSSATAEDACGLPEPAFDPSVGDSVGSRLDDRQRDIVIYDGMCNFCKAGVRQIRRMDWGGQRLAYLSLHDSRVAENFPDLTHDRLMSEMVIVDSRGNRRGGADAVRYLTRRLPILWGAAPILHIPGTASLWRWLYRQVAKRRYRLAGKSCDSGTCSLH